MGQITPVVKTIIVFIALLGFTNFIVSGSYNIPFRTSNKDVEGTGSLFAENKAFNPSIVLLLLLLKLHAMAVMTEP